MAGLVVLLAWWEWLEMAVILALMFGAVAFIWWLFINSPFTGRDGREL